MIASRSAARALQFKYPTSKAYPNISNKTGLLARVRLQARGTATDTYTQNPGRPAARPNPSALSISPVVHPARGAGANVQFAAARHARRDTVMPRASSTHGQPASLSTIRRQVVHTAHAWHGEPAKVVGD